MTPVIIVIVVAFALYVFLDRGRSRNFDRLYDLAHAALDERDHLARLVDSGDWLGAVEYSRELLEGEGEIEEEDITS